MSQKRKLLTSFVFLMMISFFLTSDNSLIELLSIVQETGLIDGACHESGGPLEAGEGWGTCEKQEIQGILINAEGSSVVDSKWGKKDGPWQIVNTLGLFNVSNQAGVCRVEFVGLIHFS